MGACSCSGQSAALELLTNTARASARSARHGTRTGGHAEEATEATEGSTAASLTSPLPGYRLPKVVTQCWNCSV